MTPSNLKMAEAFIHGGVYRYSNKVRVMSRHLELEGIYRLTGQPGFPDKNPLALNIWCEGDTKEDDKINAIFEMLGLDIRICPSAMIGCKRLYNIKTKLRYNFKLKLFHKLEPLANLIGVRVKRTLPPKPLFKLILPLP
jgi:hypothetical protein